MILRVQVGSGVHGTAVSGQDDRDEMGLCHHRADHPAVPEPDRGYLRAIRAGEISLAEVLDGPGGRAAVST